METIPPAVLESALPAAFLTIQGYRSTVFETPDGDQWAQKSTGTASSRQASDDEIMHFSPRPGDEVEVKAIDGDRFHVKGTLDELPIAGVAETTRGGGLGYTPDEGTAELTDSQYDTLVDIMDEADPSWGDTYEEGSSSRTDILTDILDEVDQEEESMDPTQIASNLRQIADKIDASKQPSRKLVAADLKKVVAAIETEAMPASNTGKQMLKKLLDDANKALESGDDAAFKAALEKLNKSA